MIKTHLCDASEIPERTIKNIGKMLFVIPNLSMLDYQINLY